MSANPPLQRALRGHRPSRPLPRTFNSADHHAWLAQHLTPRDRWLIRMLFEHKVFTSHQIIDLAFPSRRAANLRLLNLYTWGVLHRFQPIRDTGSHPMHYVLDSAGAAVLAYEEGIEPSALKYNRDREIGRVHSLQLAHNVGCNGLFTSLVRRSRHPGAAGRLTAWWSAARCGRLWGDIVTPDGYGRWQEAGRETEWFMEFDFGTEPLSRLAKKVRRYGRLADTTGITTPLLVWLRTSQRETSVRRALLEALQGLDQPGRVPIATTSASVTNEPLDMSETRWLRVGDQSGGRVPLAELHSLWPALPAPAPLATGRADVEKIEAPRVDLAPPSPTPPPDIEYRRRTLRPRTEYQAGRTAA
jgi:hypothetical protein